MRKLFFLLIILLLLTPVFAQVPNYSDKYINDYADVLSTSQRLEMRNLFYSIDQTTTAEMTLLTVETVAPLDMFSYAQEVFDTWGIGKADKDNGLLILYAKDENKIWVSVGYGLEGILPDSKIGRILDETFVPQRTAGNVSNGIVLAANAYADVIEQNKDEVLSGQTGSQNYGVPIVMILIYILIFSIPVVLNYLRKHPKCPNCKGRMTIVKTETVYETKSIIFGEFRTPKYYIVTYKCKKCDKTVTKKMKKNPERRSFIFVGGFGGGGGFSGGGFGGGGGGGGGAGR